MLKLSNLSMRYGAKILFNDVCLQFNAQERYGLVGANGSGKSTLIKILTGELTPEKGQIHIAQQQTFGALQQDHYAYESRIICDIVLEGKKKLYSALKQKEALLCEESFTEHHCEQLADIEKVIETEGGYIACGEAAKLLEGLGISKTQHDQPLHVLSGGYKLRVLLAKVLFGQPDLLVLDEPTNHLDLYSIRWLESYLRNFNGTLILTSHDRDFLNAVCTQIADIDYGTIKIYSGNYEAFLERKQLDRVHKEHMLQKHDERRSELQTFIDRFRAKASKAKQAQSKARLVERLEDQMEAIDCTPSSHIPPKLKFTMHRPSGIKVLEVKNLCKSYTSNKVLHNVSFEVQRGERIAIIGPNGIGKSTLLQILMQRQTLDQGDFTWGFAARIAYFPQDHTQEIQGTISLLDWLAQWDRDASQEQLRDLLGRVLFSGDVVYQSVSTLSGGEAARLLLAKIILQKPNVLVFDEPTNHLDMEAIEELVTALELFEGTLLLVSHNRYFVSRLAQRILEISHIGVNDFSGSYQEYLAKEEHDDHLNRHVNLNTRFHKSDNATSSVATTSYTLQKKARSEKAQLKKQIAQIEEESYQIERKIAGIHELMSQNDYYERHNLQAQQKLTQQCDTLEKQLNNIIEKWELYCIELQKYEDIS